MKLDLEQYQRLVMDIAGLGTKISKYEFSDQNDECDRQEVLRQLRLAYHFLNDINARRIQRETPDAVTATFIPKEKSP